MKFLIFVFAAMSISSLTSSTNIERLKRQIPCPLHGCTAEMLGCEQLATNDNGCPLCKCAQVPVPPPQNADRYENGINRGICLLVPDGGPCLANIERYYFNRATAKCETFNYGGCLGNENNFETIDDCSSACEASPKKIASTDLVQTDGAACFLHGCTPKILGCPSGTGLAIDENGCELCKCAAVAAPIPCPLHACTAEQLGCADGLAINENGCKLCACAPAACPLHSCTKELLGCSGELAINSNGCELCECAAVVITPSPIQLAAGSDAERGKCLLVPAGGNCRGRYLRYFFNRATRKCESFVYGGCGGNENNFETLEDCLVACGASKDIATADLVDSGPNPCFLHACTPQNLNCPEGSSLAKNELGCELCECEVQPVPCPLHGCTKEMLGCPGELATNDNGCERCECAVPPVACPFHSCTKESLGCPGELATNENGCKLCECAANTFNEKNQLDGIGGETTFLLCVMRMPQVLGIVITPAPVAEEPSAEDRGICLLPSDVGPCKGINARYFFNRATNKCEEFVYGGCQGNANNFETLEICLTACSA